MTAPRVRLSPEEWEAKQKRRRPSPEEWDLTQQAKAGLGTRRIPLPSAAADVTREVGGRPDPEAWKSAIHKPGTAEQLATGALGLPFAAVKTPVETAVGLVKGLADPVKAGRFVNQKLRGQRSPLIASETGVRAAGTPYTGPLKGEKEPISDVEGYGALLNAGLMAGGAIKASLKPKAKPVLAPEVSRTPRTIPEAPKPTLSPLGPRAVTAEQMLEVGKQRAAELERGIAPKTAPDLLPALERERPSVTVSEDPALPPAPGMPPKAPKGSKTSPWKDLSEAPDDALRAERDRIRELHAEEESSIAFTQTPEWERWQSLPSKEKLGRNTFTTDEFGNKLKRQVEDLSDADGTMDPDVLAEWRKTYNKYRQRTLVREAEVKRVAAIEAELERRSAALENPPELPPPDESSALPPPTVGEGPGMTAVTGTGEAQTRGLSAGVNVKAVANKLTTSLGDLPEFRTINMADQAAKATKLLVDDGDLARRVALGEAPPPADLLPESVFTAVENQAIAQGDVGTLRALASGDLTAQATTMGQRIRALAERNPESPVAAMQKIVEARVQGMKNAPQAMAGAVQELQRHIADAVKMDPRAWTSFIDSLRC